MAWWEWIGVITVILIVAIVRSFGVGDPFYRDELGRYARWYGRALGKR